MSRNGNPDPVTLTVKQALENIKKFSIEMPQQNTYSKSTEAVITYSGRIPIIQLGTKNDSIDCPFGVSRYNNNMRRFVAVDGSRDTQWIESEPRAWRGDSTSGKLSVSLNLRGYQTTGTQGWYAYEFFNQLYDHLVDCLVNGVPTGQTDDDGDEVRRKIVDKPLDENIVRSVMFRHPVYQSGDYDPKLTTKARFRFTRGKTLSLTGEYFDADNDNAIASDAFDVIKSRSHGVWLVKIPPLLFKKNEIIMSPELQKARVFQSRESFSSKVAFADDMDTTEDGAEMHGGGQFVDAC